MIDRERIYLGHYALRHVPAAERFAAAAAAGFAGISVHWGEVSGSYADVGRIRGLLDASGLCASMLEVIRLPGVEGLEAFVPETRRIAEIAAALDCPTVLAVCLDPGAERAAVQEGFTRLATACADHGRACAVEFVPRLSSIPDLRSALELIRTANVPGTGVIIDALHFMRSGAPWAELAKLAPGEIAGIQWCDGPTVPPLADYLTEAMHLRSLPGAGQFDLHRLVAALEAAGATASSTCEAISDELAALPAETAARHMFNATRALLQSA